MYDYLIVGTGLFGSVFAHEAAKAGKKVKLIDRRSHIGGNIYTEETAGIQVHKYGAHIFHTNDKKIWDYVQQFAEFNRYTNSPVANFHGKLYNLPFNMNTFYQLWGVITPQEAQAKIQEQRNANNVTEPQNLEEQAIALVGQDIYETLIKEYTEKQWGRPCNELPAFIIKRLPVRFTFDNNYFSDNYQGIPIGGYTKLIENMLDHDNIEVQLDTDYFANKKDFQKQAKKVIFTGMIDEYFNYEFGPLEYRSLKFESELLDTNNYQGNAVVNYTDKETPYTRIIEHKHFEFGTQDKTIITREYSSEWQLGDEAYYPVNDEKNSTTYQKYQERAQQEANVIFGGRLASYRYYDMHQVIKEALDTFDKVY